MDIYSDLRCKIHKANYSTQLKHLQLPPPYVNIGERNKEANLDHQTPQFYAFKVSFFSLLTLPRGRENYVQPVR